MIGLCIRAPPPLTLAEEAERDMQQIWRAPASPRTFSPIVCMQMRTLSNNCYRDPGDGSEENDPLVDDPTNQEINTENGHQNSSSQGDVSAQESFSQENSAVGQCQVSAGTEPQDSAADEPTDPELQAPKAKKSRNLLNRVWKSLSTK